MERINNNDEFRKALAKSSLLWFARIYFNKYLFYKIAPFQAEIYQILEDGNDFNEIIAFMVRTFFFVFIGAVANLTDFRAIGLGLIITLFLLAARFMVVYPTTLLLKLSRREMLTMGFMIPTGLSAAVLAILPYAQYKIAGTENFVDVVFTIILATTIFATVSMGIVEYTYDRVIKRKRDISH